MSRSTSPILLQDTDTVALLNEIRETNDPLSWFKGDWPLKNHFYRPVTTLTFEIDNALHKNDPAGYGTTNALIAIACVLLMFWMMREMTNSPGLTGLSTVVFALWHVNLDMFRFFSLVQTVIGFLCFFGVFRGGSQKVGICVCAALSLFFLGSQFLPAVMFDATVVHWLPGRTASVMTLFALIALASYARFVRLSSNDTIKPPTSVDTPATKSSMLGEKSNAVIWIIVSIFGLILALGSYEQAVVIPGLLVGVWLMFNLRGKRSVAWPHGVFWLILIAYFIFRSQILPTETSGYQQQQFRSGPGVWISLGDYFAPGIFASYMSLQGATLLTVLFFHSNLITTLLSFAGNIVVYVKSWLDRDQKWFVIGFLLLAFGAFIPMAWLKQFGHYHYLPSVFRAAFAVSLTSVVLKLVVNAASLPEIRAPLRQDPAPGSLLRP